MQTAQKLADVAKITLCMEVSGIHTQENVQFASVLHKCGSELTDIGTFLKEKACEITSTHQSARKSAVSSTVSTSDKSAES